MEIMVRKKLTFRVILFRVLIIAAAVAFALFLWILSFADGFKSYSTFIILVIMAECYGAFIWFSSFRVEYEYLVTNGEIDIDRITAKRRRRRLVSFKARDIERIGLYSKEAVRGTSFSKTYMVNSSDKEEGIWFAVFRNVNGTILVVFNMSENLFGAIRPYLTGYVARDAMKLIEERQ